MSLEGDLNVIAHEELVAAHGSDRFYVSFNISKAINSAMLRAYNLGRHSLREPTQEMAMSGHYASDSELSDTQARVVWEAMMSVALGEKT